MAETQTTPQSTKSMTVLKFLNTNKWILVCIFMIVFVTVWKGGTIKAFGIVISTDGQADSLAEANGIAEFEYARDEYETKHEKGLEEYPEDDRFFDEQTTK